MAKQVHEIANWHIELYIDSKDIRELYLILLSLLSASIDYLGLSKSGFKLLTKLVEKGVRVKATGFSRVDFEITTALKSLYSANPAALMFGSDLLSTRAPFPYSNDDFVLVAETLGRDAATKVFSENAIEFYRPEIS